MEEILKRTQHDRVVEDENVRSNCKEYSENEGVKGHFYIVHGNLKEHGPLIVVMVHAERIAFGNIFQGHFHVAITHDQTREVRIGVGCNCSYDCPKQKDEQGKQQAFTRTVDLQGQGCFPNREKFPERIATFFVH